MCGENAYLLFLHCLPWRITPACAGKTHAGNRMRPSHKDHPRMCGENAAVLLVGAGIAGSPPHVRGKQKPPRYEEAVCRITPACAGKTSCDPIQFGPGWDHPRMCGENTVQRSSGRELAGSPPHVRGKRVMWGPDEIMVRITPACAGKTFR